jgi:beta-glucanase (GH16 family)
MKYTYTSIINALLMGALLLLPSFELCGQIGEVIWQEDFDHLDNWIIEQGNGSWGWGNGELQYYHPDNVRIDSIPDEPDNNALVITARQETGAGIADQWGNPLNYTSGRLMSKSKVAVKYGVIETRINVPDLGIGGWPAFWLLGMSNYGWPGKGEIDMMEMGHSKSFRDLHDAHNGGNNQNNSTPNQMVSANAIFYADAAVTPDNPTGAASLSWDPDDDFCRPYYNYEDELVDRFITYRTYWDTDSLRFTVVDNDVEYELYTQAFKLDSVALEFQNPFYFIINLAIGGLLTDAYNLGDANSGLPVSMPLPAEMYVDYIKVMKWNGQGEVHLGPPVPEIGTFGLFTDSTTVDAELIPGVSSEIYVWEETLVGDTEPPYEGENVLSWSTNQKGWFGAGIMSIQPLNLFDFGEGHLKFNIKIPADVSFKIGIIDAWGNQNYVEFPANQTKYGLLRDGSWGEATIPVSDIRGLFIDLRMLSYTFVILEENGANCQFALDDIYWEGGPVVSSAPYKEEASFKLMNVPNPFNGYTTIHYYLPEGMTTQLSIYDVHGRLVKVLHNGYQTAGEHQVEWYAADVSSGVYFYSLSTEGRTITRKCILGQR